MKQSSSSKKIKSSNLGLNKADYHINRGFEVTLNGGKGAQHNKPDIKGDKKMSTEIILTMFLPVSLLFFFVGTLFGWAA